MSEASSFSGRVARLSAPTEPTPDQTVVVAGAGLMGSMVALTAAKKGYRPVLVEPRTAILEGSSKIPAHVYAGAMYCDLGPETVEHCFHDALAFVRCFPEAVNHRPTVCAVAQNDTCISKATGRRRSPLDIVEACESNRKRYTEAVASDPANQVFGPPETYYNVYSLDRLRELRETPQKEGVPFLYDNDAWMARAARSLDLETLQEPVVLMHEYGFNMRMAGAILTQQLEALKEREQLILKMGTALKTVERTEEGPVAVLSTGERILCGHVFNCAGVDGGALDDRIGLRIPRYSDIKVAGLFALPETEPFKGMPCIYVVGNPMTQFSPCDPEGKTAVVTATKPDATYIPEGVAYSGPDRSAPDIDSLGQRRYLSPLAEEETEARLAAMKGYWCARMPSFEGAEGVALLGGSVEIVGDATCRAPNPIYHHDEDLTCMS
jgi:glycine/D-amino acid oxidase-like deaminating enzyme